VDRSDTPFTRGYNAGQVIRVPTAHGEGNYVADQKTIARLEGEGRVLFRYVAPDGALDPAWNVNGATNAIAGVLNDNGNVLGLMPHPETTCTRCSGRPTDAACLPGLPITSSRRHRCGSPRPAMARTTTKRPARARNTRPARKPKARKTKRAKISPALVAAHGLSAEEYQRILVLIGREPSITELGIFSAMWNEHCSYKSSKIHLRTLPTKAPWVIQGPGENAGVIEIGEGLAAVFKMESHNHPSYIEPYQGAATGVGGILRDVFTMGARPIACLNALSF